MPRNTEDLSNAKPKVSTDARLGFATYLIAASAGSTVASGEIGTQNRECMQSRSRSHYSHHQPLELLSEMQGQKYAQERGNFSAIYPGLVYGGATRYAREGVDVMPWNGL